MKPTKHSLKSPALHKVKLSTLLSFVDKKVKIMMIVGSIAALINGATLPSMAIIFGDISNDFATSTDLISTAGKYCIALLVLGIITLMLSYISYGLWMTSGELVGLTYRKILFKALIRQEINYFDTINPNRITFDVSTICFEIQAGLGDKLSSFFYSLSMTLTGFLIGYIKGWQLALVLTCTVPCMAICGGIVISTFHIIERQKSVIYSDAAACVEESLNSIRTVTALGSQQKEFDKYYAIVSTIGMKLFKMIMKPAIALGMLNFFNVIAWSLGFYYGSQLIENETINSFTNEPWRTGDVFSVFFAISIGTSALSQIGPCLRAFASAKSAGAQALEYLNRVSKLDVEDQKGLCPEKIEGDIEFKEVEFSYPNHQDKQILKQVSFTILKNKKTAFVGESGCGKTTCLQLLERFYDPTSGAV